jgi:Glycosyltransferase 61
MSRAAAIKRQLARHLSLDQREFLTGLGKRRAGLIFASPSRSLRASVVPGDPLRLEALRSRADGDDRLSVHRDVVSYPLEEVECPDKLGTHLHGGLATGSGELIPEAVHYNGIECCQSLPESYMARYALRPHLEIRQPALYGGILYKHFGHFLSESLSRLYAYPIVRDVDPFILFHTPLGRPKYLERNSFVYQVLAGFGIPPQKLLFNESAVKLREIVVPRQNYGFGFIHDPDEAFVDFVRSFQITHQVPRGLESAEKVYVSRATLRRRGGLIGEEVFSHFLETQGYTVFYPERHTLSEQLTVYARAKTIIFVDGSALLACVLLPNLEADVAVISRRRDPRREVRSATDCLTGYGKPIRWIDAVRGQFQFGLEPYDALAEIDWKAVAEQLHMDGFICEPFRGIPDDEHAALVRRELNKYLREIVDNPRFLDHMVGLSEQYPRWEGDTHLIDPRNGLRVAPAGTARARS